MFEFIDRTEAALAVRFLDNHPTTEKIKTIKGKPFTLLNLPLYAVGKVFELVARETKIGRQDRG